MRKYLLLAAAIVSGSMTFGAVARIGSAEFDSLADALASIQGETATTITMLAGDPSAAELPPYVTVDMSPNARLTGALTGSGEVTLSAASTGSTYNQWFSEGQLAGFNGTVHLLQGRYEAQHNFSHAGLTVKIDNGAQLSTGGSGEWTCAFVVAGIGWTAEPQFAISKAALRIGNSVTGSISAQEGSVVSVGTYNSNNITISGKITAPNGLTIICNQSDASITVSGAANEISSTTITGAGAVVLGHQSAIGHTITVKSGATLNLNDKRPGTGNGYALTCESGAKLRTSNNNYNSTTAVIKSLTLAGDLTIDKPSNMSNMSLGLGIGQNGADKTTLDLGSHTLKLNNGDSFYFRGTTVIGNGTIEVAANQRVIIYQCATTAADATLKIAGNANVELQGNDGALTVKNLILNGNLAMNGSGDHPITVTGTLSGSGSIVNLALADGATIDVGEVPENGVVAQATNALTLGNDVKLAINGEVTEAYELTKEGNTVVATLKQEETNAAEVGGVKYETLDEALTHLTGWVEMTLLKDVTLAETINLDALAKGTINLNGHTITASGDVLALDIASGANVTIKGSGAIVSESGDYAIRTAAAYLYLNPTGGSPDIGGIIALPAADAATNPSAIYLEDGYSPTYPVKFWADWTGKMDNSKTTVINFVDNKTQDGKDVVDFSYDPIKEIDGQIYYAKFYSGFAGGNQLVYRMEYVYRTGPVTISTEHAAIWYLQGVITDPDTELKYAAFERYVKTGSMMIGGVSVPQYEWLAPKDNEITFEVRVAEGYQNPVVKANDVVVEKGEDGRYRISPTKTGTAIVVTAEEIPTVPTWIDSADAAAVAKYNTWATAKGVSDPTTAKKAAFAFNCENTDEAIASEKDAFVITSIEIVDGVHQVTAKLTNLAGEEYLITPVIKGSATVNGEYKLEKDDASARFFRAFIDL